MRKRGRRPGPKPDRSISRDSEGRSKTDDCKPRLLGYTRQGPGCAVPGCLAAPSNGKRHCLAHLAQIPYVRALEDELARRARAESRTGARSVPSHEIRVCLAVHGALSIARLAAMLHVPPSAVEALVGELRTAGLVRTRSAADRNGNPRVIVELA